MVSTTEIVNHPDFLPGFKPEFEQECAYQWKVYDGPQANFSHPEMRRNRHLHIYPVGTSDTDKADLYAHTDFAEVILDDLQLRDSFVEHANARLEEIKVKFIKQQESTGKKVKRSREFVYVGIHSRRTDHLEYQLKMKQVPLTVSYFLDAMDLFRAKFGRKAPKGDRKNLVFVYVSDDMQWGMDKIGIKNKVFELEIGDLEAKHSLFIHFAGEGHCFRGKRGQYIVKRNGKRSGSSRAMQPHDPVLWNILLHGGSPGWWHQRDPLSFQRVSEQKGA